MRRGGGGETVELEVPARVEYVRLVRMLVASLAASRRELDEDRLDALRLAVSEACTLAVGTDTSTRFSGTISGTSALTKIGSGTLVLSGANTHPAAPAFVPARSACQNQALGTGALTPTGSLVDYANGLPIRSWSTARPLSAGDHRNR